MSKAAIRDALKACDNNKSELARRLGISRQIVQHWARKGKVPWWWQEAVLEMAQSYRESK